MPLVVQASPGNSARVYAHTKMIHVAPDDDRTHHSQLAPAVVVQAIECFEIINCAPGLRKLAVRSTP